MAKKTQKNSNSILIPALLFTGLAFYGIKEILIPVISQSKRQTPQLPVTPIASDISSDEPRVIERTIVIDDNGNDAPPQPANDDNSNSEPTNSNDSGSGLTPKHKSQPEPKPIPPPSPSTKDTTAANGNPVTGILGNLFTEVIDKITPPENQQFYFSEQDVINNERVLIRHLSKANKGLCKLYTQWPAIKMKAAKTAKLYY